MTVEVVSGVAVELGVSMMVVVTTETSLKIELEDSVVLLIVTTLELEGGAPQLRTHFWPMIREFRFPGATEAFM